MYRHIQDATGSQKESSLIRSLICHGLEPFTGDELRIGCDNREVEYRGCRSQKQICHIVLGKANSGGFLRDRQIKWRLAQGGRSKGLTEPF